MYPISICLSYDPTTPHIYTLSLHDALPIFCEHRTGRIALGNGRALARPEDLERGIGPEDAQLVGAVELGDRKSTRLNSSHEWISYAVFCLKKKKNHIDARQGCMNTEGISAE